MRRFAAAVTVAAALAVPAGAQATFPGANGQIVFARSTGSTINLVDPSTQQESPLVPSFGAGDYIPGPTFSADGEYVVYSRNVGLQSNLYMIGVDGQNEVQLTNGGGDFYPALSPDGGRIVFSRIVGSDTEIFVMDLDGQNPMQLTDNASQDEGPSFSPDGSRIVFSRFLGGSNSDVYIMDADGQNQTPLTNSPDYDINPAFSPDGQRIVYANGDGSPREIWVMDTAGNGKTQLTSLGVNSLYPNFSPDGQRIVFASSVTGSLDLYTMTASGQDIAFLTGTPGATEFWTNWQPLNPPDVEVTAGVQKSPRAVTVTVVSRDEDATATLDGTLRAAIPKPKAPASKKKTVELDGITVELQPGVPVTVDIPVAGKGKKLIKKSRKAGKRPKGAVTVTATDDLGGSAGDSADVRYKKKKKK